MGMDRYEVRGLRLLVQSTKLAMRHLCTFAISFRLPSASYWVAYYGFYENTATSKFLEEFGTAETIARGANVLPSVMMVEGGMSPKEVLDFESAGVLNYYRTPNSKKVYVRIVPSKAGQRVVHFNLEEQTALTPATGVTTENHFIYTGKISRWQEYRGYKRDQILQRSPLISPAPNFAFEP